MTQQETIILAELQNGLAVGPRPFCALAEKAGCTEEEAFNAVQALVKNGTIRKLGGFINHIAAGFQANGMVVWDVEENRVEEAGKCLSSYQNVSHCYARPRSEKWPYRLYTMIHGRSRKEVEEQAKEMSAWEGIPNYKIVFSVREYKKANRWLV